MTINKDFKRLSFGGRLKYILKKQGRSQRWLSDLLEITDRQMSRIANDNADPGINKIKLISFYLDINIHWLITGSGPIMMAKEVVSEPEVPYFSNSLIDIISDLGDDQEDQRKLDDMVKKYKRLNPEQQRLIKDLIDMYSEKGEEDDL